MRGNERGLTDKEEDEGNHGYCGGCHGGWWVGWRRRDGGGVVGAVKDGTLTALLSLAIAKCCKKLIGKGGRAACRAVAFYVELERGTVCEQTDFDVSTRRGCGTRVWLRLSGGNCAPL